MTYTVWMHGRRIGDTRFEVADHFQRRAGSFHPTPHGLTVLPGLTALFPALLEFAELCRRHGFDVDESWLQAVSTTAEAFSNSPEGQRVLAAAERIADVEVRDSTGQQLAWESLSITELDRLIPITSAPGRQIHDPMSRVARDPVRYMISMTLASSQVQRAGLFSTIRRAKDRTRVAGRGLADPR